ncbi:hypothetical protein Tco_0641462 [Tanacetum coccineum]
MSMMMFVHAETNATFCGLEDDAVELYITFRPLRFLYKSSKLRSVTSLFASSLLRKLGTRQSVDYRESFKLLLQRYTFASSWGLVISTKSRFDGHTTISFGISHLMELGKMIFCSGRQDLNLSLCICRVCWVGVCGDDGGGGGGGGISSCDPDSLVLWMKVYNLILIGSFYSEFLIGSDTTCESLMNRSLQPIKDDSQDENVIPNKEGLAAGIEHGQAGRCLTDLEAYIPSAEDDFNSAVCDLRGLNFPLLQELSNKKDASTWDVMDLLRLDDAVAEALG